MVMRIDSRLKQGAASLALAAALVLGGCNRANELTQEQQQEASTARLPDLPATLPLSAGEATPLAYAPAADALPDVAPVRAVRVADQSRSYAYADTAYDFADALGDAPPDYGFDYEGVDPWAWQGYDDSQVFAEPIDDGYRYYYYRAGADEPYFVRDPDYGYGYDGGNLAIVYANDGGIVPWADYGPRIVYASRYMNRGRNLWRASRVRRLPVVAANWNARRPVILQSRRAWAKARVQQPGWAAYRQRYNRDARTYWRPEAQRREADARRFVGWQAQNFRTPPPPRAIPAAWQKASWARDERRYAPARVERRALFAARPDGDRFDAQRRQAIAQREQAAAARQQRFDGSPRQALFERRDDRQREQLRNAQQAQRQQAQQVRQSQVAERQQREQARNAQQAQRQQAQQARQSQAAERQQREQARNAQQAQRQQAQQARQSQAAERQQREQARAAQQAQRQQAQQTRQSQAAERQQREQARAAQQTQRQQAQQARQSQAAERQQREQARAAQQAQRQQAQQARQSQMAERQQREQARAAQQAQREQANQARQAQTAQRQQREQANQARQAQRAQADQARQAQAAQRQQAQAARQQQRAERMANRPDRGGGGGRER